MKPQDPPGDERLFLRQKPNKMAQRRMARELNPEASHSRRLPEPATRLPQTPFYSSQASEESCFLASPEPYISSPEVHSKLWEYPGEGIGRRNSNVQTSTPFKSHLNMKVGSPSLAPTPADTRWREFYQASPSPTAESPGNTPAMYRSDISASDASSTLADSWNFTTSPRGPGIPRSQEPQRSPGAPYSPGIPRSQEPQRSPDSPLVSPPQFSGHGTRRKLSYQPEPTPDITFEEPRSDERQKKRLVPDRRFSQLSDSSDGNDSATVPKAVPADMGQYGRFRKRRMKAPCCRIRESMFLSKASTPGTSRIQFFKPANSPIYENEPVHGRSNVWAGSVLSNDSSYPSTMYTDHTGSAHESSWETGPTRSETGYGSLNTTPSRAGSTWYLAGSEGVNKTYSTMKTPPSVAGWASPAGDTSNVFQLTSSTFTSFLRQQQVAAVIFYNSFTNKSGVVEDWAKQYISQNLPVSKQVYASVDCGQEAQLCARENIIDTPFFKLYSKGFLVKESHDFAIISKGRRSK